MTKSSLTQSHLPRHASKITEVPFSIFPMSRPTTNNPTKINILASSIPLRTARIMDLTFLSLGIILNLLIIMVIVSRSSMRTSTNLYIISLACSNMVILIEPFDNLFRWYFDVDIGLNMDYVCMISFDVSVVTIAVLKFQLYIQIFQHHTPFGERLLKKLTAIKGIFLIWSATIISLAIGLHIYELLERDMAHIYVWNSFMFITMPFIVFVALDTLILYELRILKEIEGSWRKKELKRCAKFVIVAVAFYLIRMPYRLARAINFIEPRASCCTDNKREILYFMAKTFPIVFAMIYIALSTEFHRALQVCSQAN
ncbi:uncharacterized protein LOC143371489 [Andrena cerasifolii]|uniref:uncharacterized protein LOC143371489 n=1 Tax=Andrena cerasifolii TaxID=2819439 RepID=UPI004037C795